jgi:hypothetical protein
VAQYKVLVCGGRDFTDQNAVFNALDILRKGTELTVIQGGATGADALARKWCALQPNVNMINEPADWRAHGRAAGPIRNQLMIDKHKPDVVIAFAGGKGTADMVRRAKAAGILVIVKTKD